jgi:uncharacterized protein YbjT (DUF2867 family)
MENNTPRHETVFVVGATGFLGMEICRQLIEANKKVKGLVRTTSDPAKVQALKDMGVETIVGDIKERSSLMPGCQVSDAVISTATSTISRQEGDSIETVDEAGQLNLVDAAITGGVKKFVFISFTGAPGDVPLQDAKRAVEKKLSESKLEFTILRANIFMEIWLSPMLGFDYPNAKATIYGTGENKISWISLKDVATFAMASLDNPTAKNATIEIGGPEELSYLEVVRIFEEQGGKPFTVQHVPESALMAQRDAATDSMSKSFACLMLNLAQGTVVKMRKVLQDFPIQLTSVQDYARQVLPVAETV